MRRRMIFSALLAAVALTIFVLEAQIPVPLPIPGLKLGLSNTVILFALVALGWREALAVLLIKICLGNIFTGQAMALLYSLAGGALSFPAMVLAQRLLPREQLWVAGVAGGLAHNFGQMAVAVAVTQTPTLLWYLAVLLLCGTVTGTVTGLCAQLLQNRLRRFFP